MRSNTTPQQSKLWSLLGELPSFDHKIKVTTLSTERTEHFSREKLLLDLNGIQPTQAWFVTPREVKGPLPTILYFHAHGGTYELGCDELVHGRPQICGPPYAEQLAAAGYCSFSYDAWNFGSRHHRTESSLFKEMLWRGQVLWGMMMFDAVKAIDYLCTRPEVDNQRIATLGLSMGSTTSWWCAALDERVSVCVDICCLTDYDALIEDNGLDRHGLYYYVPSLLRHFTASQINSMIAPRPHLSLVGTRDPLTPLAGVKKIEREVTAVYRAHNATERWRVSCHEAPHQETPEMRTEIMEWLGMWL